MKYIFLTQENMRNKTFVQIVLSEPGLIYACAKYDACQEFKCKTGTLS